MHAHIYECCAWCVVHVGFNVDRVKDIPACSYMFVSIVCVQCAMCVNVRVSKHINIEPILGIMH